MQQVWKDGGCKLGPAEAQQPDPVSQSKKLSQLPAANPNRKLNNMIIMHENFKKCMEADDLQNFNGTAYKAEAKKFAS